MKKVKIIVFTIIERMKTRKTKRDYLENPFKDSFAMPHIYETIKML